MEAILYVEDETFVREAVREILRAAGYCVFAAKTAAEAVGIYDEHAAEIDLLLTDIVLPGEKGGQLAKRLRSVNPSLKVLLVTGYGEQLAKREDTWEECLAKPFTSAVLLEKIGQLLDAREPPLGGEELVRRACSGA
jgi:CheY-like chemotaxis protein